MSKKVGYINAKRMFLPVSTYTTTDDLSLTDALIKKYTTILINGAHAVTLPAAAAGNAGLWILVASANAGGTLVCAAGFSGGGAGVDTISLTAGEATLAWSDGTNWYAITPAVVPA